MNKKYRPSNSTEGMGFTEHFCDRCINQHPDPNSPKQCMILCRTMVHDVKDNEYPEEWTYDEKGSPTCTAWKKWYWGRDDDGNWIEPPEAPPENPNQLVMPFIFDELEIPKIKKQTTA